MKRLIKRIHEQNKNALSLESKYWRAACWAVDRSKDLPPSYMHLINELGKFRAHYLVPKSIKNHLKILVVYKLLNNEIKGAQHD